MSREIPIKMWDALPYVFQGEAGTEKTWFHATWDSHNKQKMEVSYKEK